MMLSGCFSIVVVHGIVAPATPVRFREAANWNLFRVSFFGEKRRTVCSVGLGLGWWEHVNRTWQALSKSIFVVNPTWSTAIYGDVDFLDTAQRSRPPWPLGREFFQSALYLSAYKISLHMGISSQPTHPCTVTIFTLRPYLCSLGLKSSTICICTFWRSIQQQSQPQPQPRQQPTNLV